MKVALVVERWVIRAHEDGTLLPSELDILWRRYRDLAHAHATGVLT